MKETEKLSVDFKAKYVYVLSYVDTNCIDKTGSIMSINKSHDDINLTSDIKIETADIINNTTFTLKQKINHLINLWNAMNNANNYFKNNN